MRFSIILLFILHSFLSSAKKNIDLALECRQIHGLWLNHDLKLIKNCVGYSAPVSARTLAYLSIGFYESTVELLEGNKSLSGQISGYNRTTFSENKLTLFYPHVANHLNYTLAKFFFANMPPSEAAEVEELYKIICAAYKGQCSRKSLETARIYAENLAKELMELSKLDGGHLSYGKNFPSSYAPPECQGCWVRTYPGYKPALLPYWGKNKLLLSTNGQQCDSISFIPYSTDPSSSFCSEAMKISDLYLNISNEHETIAEYWDDGPGISGTPPGHLFQLALDLSDSKSLNLQTFVELFASLGIALNDAFIETWRLKYEYNIIRPISYIQEYIRKDFNTLLETPSFPEFPSGHSFQAGAGTEILIHYFSDDLEFVDSTNVSRKDINGSARTFTNFSELAEEMSISRFYGGIHFIKTLEISLNYGQLIGRNAIKNLNFH